MKINTVEPFRFAHTIKQFPKQQYPQFVFAGRSNVGKSSLINCLLNRKTIARVSKTPGKTISINFFLVNEEFFFVDLPGFGYAVDRKGSRSNWDKLADAYFSRFSKLITLFHLVDARIGPTKLDYAMEEYCEQFDFPRYILITKSDKLKRNQVKKSLKGITESLRMFNITELIMFSSKTKTGKNEVLRRIHEKVT